MMAYKGKNHSNSVHVEIFAAGDGIHYPKKGHTVILHYSAFLRNENGEMFDCSRKRKKTFRFKLFTEQVIPGLEEGISQLSIGERAKIFIPSKHAYGKSGFPGLVPKNCDLVFDVELIDFH